VIAATPTPTWYLILAAVLFAIGAVGVLTRRTPLVMFMCIELMLNAVNLSFVAMSKRLGDIGGQTAVFFVLVVAAAEVVVGLGIIVSILRRRPGATLAHVGCRIRDAHHTRMRLPRTRTAPSPRLRGEGGVRGPIGLLRLADAPPHPPRFARRPLPASGER